MARQDWQAVRVAFDELRREDLTEKARFKEAERWRDRLIKEGRPALEAFLAQTGASLANFRLWSANSAATTTPGVARWRGRFSGRCMRS